MRVLITTASKHGSTHQIARAIAEVLEGRSLEVAVFPVDEVATLESYDAFVIGSGVYAGHWIKLAKEFVVQNADRIARHPTWLFSSGPLGLPPKPEGDVDIADLVTITCARDHRVFEGALEKGDLSFAERAIVKAVRAPYGDFRDWAAIRAWASQIADALVKLRSEQLATL